MTKSELVQKMNLEKHFPEYEIDYAIPMDFSNTLPDQLRFHFVWLYTSVNCFTGQPFPLSNEAENWCRSKGIEYFPQIEKIWPMD